MAAVTSRIVGPSNCGSGTNTLFTGTAAHTYTFRGLRIVNNTSAAITVKVGIGGVTDAVLIVPETVIPSKSAYTDTDGFVLSGTETLQVNASATGTTLSGWGVDES